ncbi:uncharacterized protein YndB with AHSA1/START domain [Allocatelliglobosispora scoriae]|uniref:Uncharacterized protein YndB with AHSA1/START domain n=1 Tax=Allocatelliglobosispora scoriae TaxID=643052 RepID=A0A841BTV8_9ACTN|nr:SRPBCC domain-containing protein [Allocatelliglobosispora scoriae]MBB5870210.1 uncharacterized protein YndB with AHSA1/START domain [Allocatelliglobosispora scoriae]
MSEISLDVDLAHPRERVWRSLTDRRLLDEWFMQSDMEPREGATFTAYPVGVAGFTGPFEVDLIEVAAPRRLHLRMRGDQLHADMTWELEERPEGCRLSVRQTGFLGVNGTLRRRELRRTYQRLFAEALPVMLARIAAGEVDLGGSVEALHTGMPRQRGPQQLVGAAKLPTRRHLPDAPPAAVVAEPSALPQRQPLPEQPERRRGRRVLAVLVTGLMIAALVGFLWATRPRAGDPIAGIPEVDVTRVPAVAQQPGDEPSATPTPWVSGAAAAPGVSGSPAPGVSSGTVPTTGPSGGPVPSPSVEPTRGPSEPIVLTAGYSTVTEHGVLGIGYVAKVTTTVKNPGTEAREGWRVVMTIPDGAEVSNKSSALVNVAISGGTVTITPNAQSKTIAAGGQIAFTYHFSGGSLLGLGTGSVKTCTVDGKTCSTS